MVAWARYGHAAAQRHPRDELLDRFLPTPEVDEYHQLRVRASAAVTFAAAKQTDIQAALLVKAIFWLRAIPALLRREPFRPQGSKGIVAETLGLGWVAALFLIAHGLIHASYLPAPPAAEAGSINGPSAWTGHWY